MLRITYSLQRQLIGLLLFSASCVGFAQQPKIVKKQQDTVAVHIAEWHKMKEDNAAMKKELRRAANERFVLRQQLEAQAKALDSLKQGQLSSAENERKLQDTIQQHHRNFSENWDITGRKITEFASWGLGITGTLLLMGIAAYCYLHRKQKKGGKLLQAEIRQSQQEVENKIVEELAKQTALLLQQSEALQQNVAQNVQTGEIDHNLALKLASEITIIERNIGLMDEKTKGLKQLKRSTQKLKDNLLANGYEIPELLHKKYVQGMNVQVVNAVPDENLEAGVELISKILVPQVNYQGKIIQTAQIEISIG